jgi:hypothetical protein
MKCYRVEHQGMGMTSTARLWTSFFSQDVGQYSALSAPREEDVMDEKTAAVIARTRMQRGESGSSSVIRKTLGGLTVADYSVTASR